MIPPPSPSTPSDGTLRPQPEMNLNRSGSDPNRFSRFRRRIDARTEVLVEVLERAGHVLPSYSELSVFVGRRDADCQNAKPLCAYGGGRNPWVLSAISLAEEAGIALV
jgi:hypothetical protein